MGLFKKTEEKAHAAIDDVTTSVKSTCNNAKELLQSSDSKLTIALGAAVLGLGIWTISNLVQIKLGLKAIDMLNKTEIVNSVVVKK